MTCMMRGRKVAAVAAAAVAGEWWRVAAVCGDAAWQCVAHVYVADYADMLKCLCSGAGLCLETPACAVVMLAPVLASLAVASTERRAYTFLQMTLFAAVYCCLLSAACSSSKTSSSSGSGARTAHPPPRKTADEEIDDMLAALKKKMNK